MTIKPSAWFKLMICWGCMLCFVAGINFVFVFTGNSLIGIFSGIVVAAFCLLVAWLMISTGIKNLREIKDE